MLYTLHYFLPGLQAFPLLVSVLGGGEGEPSSVVIKVLGLGGLFSFLGFWWDKFSTRIPNDRHALNTAIILAKIGT